jgi:hypothetical protein
MSPKLGDPLALLHQVDLGEPQLLALGEILVRFVG